MASELDQPQQCFLAREQFKGARSKKEHDPPPKGITPSAFTATPSTTTSDYYSSGSEESFHCGGGGGVWENPSTPQPPLEGPRCRRDSLPRRESLCRALKADDIIRMAAAQNCSPTMPRVYKLVLTGGPCGGKTTGQDRLASFFETLGWKVFTVPETATILLSGGVKFSELNARQTHEFQKDLLLTLLQIEKVFFNQAALIKDRNVLIICDRGAMDPSAYLQAEGWSKILQECELSMFDLREDRYDQIVHMVTAAEGAEDYYTRSNNATRSEGIIEAVKQDDATKNAWIGHPYVDIVDNRGRNFHDKILQLIQVVCDRIGIVTGDRLAKNSKKRKWLVRAVEESRFPKFEEFTVQHDYLLVDDPAIQVRIRRRCQNNRSTFTLTTRKQMQSEWVETRMQLPQREYTRYMAMKDKSRVTLYKRRRCFTFGAEFFHLDTYVDPLPPACQGHPLMILETYTTTPIGDPEPALPDFMSIEREITAENAFSMHKLAYFGAQPIFPVLPTIAAAEQKKKTVQ